MATEYLTCQLPFDANGYICKQCQSHDFCEGIINQEQKKESDQVKIYLICQKEYHEGNSDIVVEVTEILECYFQKENADKALIGKDERTFIKEVEIKDYSSIWPMC
jgi:hypothetical protein